jgi:hypothetical protein
MTALKNSQATQQQRITQARAGVAQATSSLEGYGADMSSTTTAAVIDQDKKIAELEGALAKARKERDQQTLTAPVGRYCAISCGHSCWPGCIACAAARDDCTERGNALCRWTSQSE